MRAKLLPCITLVLLACASGRVWARDTIIWHYFDFPPLYILSAGGAEPQGAAIELQDRLIAALDGFDHVRRRYTIARAFTLARADVLLCFVGPHRTPEREAFLTYSRPFFVYAPPVLTVRIDATAASGGRRPESLVRVLTDHGDRFALPAELSYGPTVDDILRQHGGAALRLYGEGRNERALALLAVGRIDYTIVQPLEFSWIADRRGLRDTLTQVPLIEATAFEGFAVACTDSQAGRQVVAEIDRLLSDPTTAAAFENVMLQWVEPRLRPMFSEALAEIQSTWR